MRILAEMVRNIVALVLFTTFLDLLLPSGGMRRYIKAVMGLYIIITLVNPLLGLFKAKDYAVMAWDHDHSLTKITDLERQNRRLEEVNRGLFSQNYARKLEQQMTALARLVKGVEKVTTKVELESRIPEGTVPGIKEVTVTVGSGIALVEPIEIKPGEGRESPRTLTKEEQRIAREIRGVLSQYFDLQSEIIKVHFS